MAKLGCIAVVIGIENVLDENLSGREKSNQFKATRWKKWSVS